MLFPGGSAGASTVAPFSLTASGSTGALGLHPHPVRGPRGGVYSYEGRGDQKRPLMVVIGASFAYGVGAGGPRRAWPEDLARRIDWRLVVAADPGAGYINRGNDHLGPFSHLLSRLDLAKLRPRLVIVQGGHDDLGWRPLLERRRVQELISTIRTEAPAAKIAVLSVFSARERPRPRLWAIDRAVVQGALAGDPRALICNPIASSWDYPRLPGHLHPTEKGYDWIARRLADLLRKADVVASRRSGLPSARPVVLPA
jgi:lysophospholipase L1-like esterase